ncbi:hypothetical protein Y032_0501g2604 [Ancylostoma ceylanicum]|uniref:Uncharacterized protein n=1 Tax=Ancylostoma ceylanicum TaxID=53326 RepID=A0A016WU37_9BILA|nr:hypothetical protein Y032_0501g2604 [Ancylostoma ceylanicum]
MLLDDKTAEVPLKDAIVNAGVLNGHVGATKDEVARSVLGTTKQGRRRIDRLAWLWTDEVKKKLRVKKRLYHVFLRDKTNDNWQKYLEAKKAAKKAVAATKAKHYDYDSKKQGEKDGEERLIYRMARSRSGRPKTSKSTTALFIVRRSPIPSVPDAGQKGYSPQTVVHSLAFNIYYAY